MIEGQVERSNRLGSLIERRRTELGMSVSQAARTASISRSTWHKIEDGQATNVRSVTWARVERLLGWPGWSCQSYLDGGDEPVGRDVAVEPAAAGDKHVQAEEEEVEQDALPRAGRCSISIAYPDGTVEYWDSPEGFGEALSVLLGPSDVIEGPGAQSF